MQSEYSEDTIWRSDIRILQPVKGYRFALDAVLLAHFIKTKPSDILLEVGAGTGVVTILLSALQKFQSVSAIEIQKELAELCKKNFELNGLNNGEVYETDVKNLGDLLKGASFDVIYSNPPYRKPRSGRLNPSEQKAIARHEVKMELLDLFECAGKFLKPTGRLITILPAFRQQDFQKLTEKYKLHLDERKYVHSFRDDPPAFFLSVLSKGHDTSDFFEHPALIIYEDRGKYTEEMNRLLKA